MAPPTNTAAPKAVPRGKAGRKSAEFVSLAAGPLPFPLVLQRRAPQALRKHALRMMLRVSVLLGADLLTLVGARSIIHGVGDAGWLGDRAATVMRALVPHGAYPILQVIVAMVACLAFFGSYRAGDNRNAARPLVLGSAFGIGITVWAPLWSWFTWPLLGGAIAGALAVGALLTVERALVDVVVRRVRLSRGHPVRAIVIGTREDAARALANAALSDPTEFQVLGYVDSDAAAASGALGHVSDIVSIIAHWRIDTLVMAGSFGERQWTHLVHLADAAGCQVLTLPGTLMLEGFAPRLMWRRGVPLVQITRPGLRGHQMVLKRLFDIVVSAGALLVLSPVLATIALAIKASSRGPVLFRQRRVGRAGRKFAIYKFRSMVADAEARLEKLREASVYGDPRLFKVERDPRITRLGAFLRRTSLDELPQLWNVLTGDMSLVGPRPPLPSEVALYDDHHYSRFDVKPGITGPWQVSGRNRIRDFEEVMRLETAYIRDWGLRKDLAILLRTVPAVFRMDGAY